MLITAEVIHSIVSEKIGMLCYRMFGCLIVKLFFFFSFPTFSFAQQLTPWPEWIFYHWIWEGESTQQSAIAIADDYLQRDIPVGAIIIDSPWETGYNTFVFDTSLFADAQGMIASFHSKNIRTVLWITGIVNIENDSLFNYGVSQNFFLRKNKLDDSTLIAWWKGEGRLIDFYNPAARAWWQQLMDKALALGIDGWKCDGTDFYALLTPYSPYLDTVVNHNDYSDKYYRIFFDSTRSALGNDRVIFARPIDNYGNDFGGSLASFAPVDINFAGWVGDQDPSFDGLKNALNNMYYSSQMNYLAFGSDIGGYREDNVNYPGMGRSKELFIRWAQMGAFMPIMENGGSGEHRPWMFDQETTDIYRQFTKLHYALVPYFMQEADSAYQAGKSIVVFFNKSDYSYLLGNDLFVAPFLQSGTNINITLPQGDNWIYLFDSSVVFAGGTNQSLNIPISEFPVFVKAGSELTGYIFTGIKNIALDEGAKIYPNPFVQYTHIEYFLKEKTEVLIEIFDLLTNRIYSERINEQLPGKHAFFLSSKETCLTKGIYLLKLSAGDRSERHRIVVME